MTVLEATGLGLVQGATEFLPVSSSGHLTLAERAMGVRLDDILALDVMLHAATLAAMLVFFARAWIRRIVAHPRLGLLALAAGVPAGLAYLAVRDEGVEAVKAQLWAVGVCFLAGGAFMTVASLCSKRMHRDSDGAAPGGNDVSGLVHNGPRGLLDALAIGLAQAVALLPGVSRSGATISAGLLAGVGPEAAFEFSFLTGAPLMFGAVLVKARGMNAIAGGLPAAAAAGTAAAFASGLVALWLLRRAVIRGWLWAFGAYVAAVGVACLVWPNGGTT